MSDSVLVDVVIPQLGEAVSEVRIVEWEKSEGDQVSVGDVLFIVDTEKAEVDVDAFVDGVLVEIGVPDDTATMPGAVVGRIRTTQDAAGLLPPPGPTTEAAPEQAIEVAPEPTPQAPATVVKPRSGQRATPKARKLARELGVDPAEATSSRSDGVISADDISRLAAESSPAASDEIRDTAQRFGETMALRMTESKQTVPHFYLTVDVDMTRVLAVRAEAKASSRGVAPALTSFIVLAAAMAAREHPHLISRDDDVESMGVGVAVATDAGLIVPTVDAADPLDLWSVDERLSVTIERARSLKLRPSDLAPKRITISNLGMFGIDAFYGIIDPPDTMLISVGATTDRVVARDNKMLILPMATFGLSADHRQMDGAAAAPFLTGLRDILESGDVFTAAPPEG